MGIDLNGRIKKLQEERAGINEQIRQLNQGITDAQNQILVLMKKADVITGKIEAYQEMLEKDEK